MSILSICGLNYDHKNTYKYLSGEITKCELDQSLIIENKVNCNNIKNGNAVGIAVAGPNGALSDFVNAHNNKNAITISLTGKGGGEMSKLSQINGTNKKI